MSSTDKPAPVPPRDPDTPNRVRFLYESCGGGRSGGRAEDFQPRGKLGKDAKPSGATVSWPNCVLHLKFVSNSQ